MSTRSHLGRIAFRTFATIAILVTSLPLMSSQTLAQEGAPTEGSIEETESPSAARRLAPGLRLYAACDPVAVAPGGRATCTVTAVNESDEDLSNLKLSARLPRGLSLTDQRGSGDVWRGSIASLPVGESASVQFALDVGPDLPSPQAFEVEARVGAKTLAATTGIVGVGGTETQWVSRNGGEVEIQGGRVRIEFPGGALRASAGARVSARTHEQQIDPRGRARDDGDEETRGRSGTLLRFSLQAEDAGTGENIEHFEQAVSVSVDLRGLVDEAGLPAGQHVYLAYVIDADTGEKKEVDSVYDAETGVLTAEVDHFSEWEIGMVGEGWKPILTPPVPDLFSGAATYSYPIQVPAGRNGLQPSVTLSYSSRRIDMLKEMDEEDGGPVALGWSLGGSEVEVTRYNKIGGTSGNLELHDDFSLVLNGASYDLENVTGYHCGEYRAVGAPGVYVERRNEMCSNGSTQNRTTDYWIVRVEGTTYRLGYTYNSEADIEQGSRVQCFGTYCSPDPDSYGATRWRVDTVTDPLGNQMAFSYREKEIKIAVSGTDAYAERSMLTEIRYNSHSMYKWASKVVFVPVSDDEDSANYMRIDRIDVYHLDQRVRQVRLVADKTTWDGYSEWALMRIQELSGGGTPMPPVEFRYEALPNRNNNYYYRRISEINLGYGGRTTFQYVNDGRADRYSYRVSETETYDGMSDTPSRVTYAYGQRCYDQKDITKTAGGALCRGATAYQRETGPLVGHEWVTVTAYDFSETPVNKVTHHYYITDTGDNHLPPHWQRGKEWKTEVYAGDGTTLLQESSTEWKGDNEFSYVAETTSTDHTGRESISTTTAYSYTLAAQGGVQYGNLTHVWEYGDSDTPYRTTVTTYNPNARSTAWRYDYDHDGSMDATSGLWGAAGYYPLAGDFDGDSKSDDVAVFSPSTGMWYYDYNHDGTTNGTSGPWGTAGDLPLAGDFDGDGRADDVAVFRPSTGVWYYDHNHNGTTEGTSGPWGTTGDLPVAGDFDGDNKSDDVAVFRSSTGVWYYDYDHNGTTEGTSGAWGVPGDQPLVGDFDEDGKNDDVAVYRPWNGMWYYDHNHNGTTDGIHGPWAPMSDRPLAGDFDADGTVDDVAVFGFVWIVGTPQEVKVYGGDEDGTLLGHTQSYYDGATDLATLPVTGKLTMVRQINPLEEEEVIETRSEYDTWGNVTGVWDPLDKHTEIIYEAPYNLYPVEAINAASNHRYVEYYGVNDGVGGEPLEEFVWVEDGLPAGATPYGTWTWVTSNPTPYSGSQAHQSVKTDGVHQHYFANASATMAVQAGDRLFTYVYLDPNNVPREVMLQWNDGSWLHRAYWGDNLIEWGINGSVERRYMGSLPKAGGWVRLEVDAELVGLAGSTVHGMAFALYDGRATWDRTGTARGGLSGQVWRVWDSNGEETATQYAYDAVGRLAKVMRPGDYDPDYPTIADYPTTAYWYDETTAGTRVVREYYSDKWRDTAYNTVENWETTVDKDYAYQRAPFRVRATQEAGTVPLRRFLYVGGSHSYQHNTLYTTSGGASGWEDQGVLGYIWTSPGSGRVGLYRCAVVESSTYDHLLVVGDEACPAGYDDEGRVLVGYVEPADAPIRVGASQREVSGLAGTLDGYVYYDGLGRQIQSRSEADDGQWTVASTEYDALGRAFKGYLPRFEDELAYTAPDGLHTLTTFDTLGRAVRTVNPDNTSTSVLYDGLETVGIDGNGHLRISRSDVWGQLVQVDETLAEVEDTFLTLDDDLWTFSGHQSIEDGTIKTVGPSSWSGTFYRDELLVSDGEGTFVVFRVDSTSALAAWGLETVPPYPDSNYRRWSLRVEAGKLRAFWCQGGNCGWANLMDVKAGTWYGLLLRVEEDGYGRLQVWERSDPAVSASYVSQDAIFGGRDYRFRQWTHTGTSWMHRYDELEFHTTDYEYDTLGHLVKVTDAAQPPAERNETEMHYDGLGRKDWMNDPDMGHWEYRYDEVGNLTKQRDARDQAICFYYDDLHRLEGKKYHTGVTDIDALDCTTMSYDIAYTYDVHDPPDNYGIGRLTRMDDLSGWTEWSYDERGRVTREEKDIDGASTFFVTTYTYDAADRVTSMTYPDGEVLAYGYNDGGALESLSTNVVGQDPYVENIAYDALGQITTMGYGNEVTTGYVYDPLTQRLRNVRVSKGTNPLLNLSYDYDAVGNVTQIADNHAPVFQDTFDTKDSTNWVWSAYQMVPHNDGGSNVVKSTGTGTNYDATFYRNGGYTLQEGDSVQLEFKLDSANTEAHFGIESGEGASYRRWGIVEGWGGYLRVNYNDGSGHHVDWDVGGSFSLQVGEWYVVILRVGEGGMLYTDLWQKDDPSNSRHQEMAMESGLNWRFHHWIKNGTAYIDGYEETDAVQQFEYDHLDRLTHAQATGGPAPYERTYAYDAIGNILNKSDVGDYEYNDPNHVHAVTDIDDQQLYGYDENGNMTDRDIPGDGDYDLTFSAENKLVQVDKDSSTVATFTYDGNGARVKKVESGVTTYYVGGYYELQDGTVTKYYRYCAMSSCQIVAMRQGPAGQAGTVTYLHGDHLGSTSLTTDAGGAVTARVLYYPYGEERYREGALQTDYQFTGQRREGFGLYDYQARFYDHALGRFISADTIVPGTENPQSWNRYAYVLNNPMLHVDPTGHMPGYNCADGYCRGRASNAPKKEEKAADVTPEAGPLPSITIYASAGASEGLAALALPHVYPDDPPPPPEGEQQHESDSLRLSAVGWRVDVSAGAILGGDLDVDFLLNFHDLRNIHANVSIVPGGQVEFLGGAGASTGPLFVFNLPENEDLDGWGWRVGGTAYPEIGMEIEVFGPLSDQEGDPFGVYVGFGGGEEVCGYGGVSYAFDITDWFMGVAATPD